MSVLMTCARRYTLRTTSGHCIRFEPNNPVEVPDSIVHEAMAVNIIPVEGVVPDVDDEDAGVPRVQIGGILRDALVLHSIDNIVKENDSTQFDAGGRPKVNLINQAAGVTLTAEERNTYWDRYRTLKGAGEDLPKHKAMATLLEIQYLNTPKDVLEYASALNIKPEMLTGRSLRAQKQILTNAAIKG